MRGDLLTEAVEWRVKSFSHDFKRRRKYEHYYEAEPVERSSNDVRYAVFLLPFEIMLFKVHEHHVERPVHHGQYRDDDEFNGVVNHMLSEGLRLSLLRPL